MGVGNKRLWVVPTFFQKWQMGGFYSIVDTAECTRHFTIIRSLFIRSGVRSTTVVTQHVGGERDVGQTLI